MLILKINFKKIKNIILIYFQINILKNNVCHVLKESLAIKKIV